MKKIAIIDADLINRKKHRFPNLACLKMSGYWKEQGYNVKLLTEYNKDALFGGYEQIFLSKVFTDTSVPDWVLELPNISYGGTGFFYDKAERLKPEIEHHMPDYHLYDDFVNDQLSNGGKRIDFKYYLDYSIGFMTRGCFRQCPFCVNKNYKRVEKHSPLTEFMDVSRKKICLLDDNFLGCPNWKEMLLELKATGKPFRFHQGMDERILTDEKCELLFSSKYDGEITFAFDNIADYELIERKLQMIRRHTDKVVRFYVLVGFDRNEKYDLDFWQQDLWDMFKRIELLMKYQAIPYIMRFNRYVESPYKGLYITAAGWCNQPSLFKKKTITEFAQQRSKADVRYIELVQTEMPELANRYFNMRYK